MPVNSRRKAPKNLEANKMKFPLGIQLWSVRDHCSEDLEGSLKKIKEIGYDGVEPYTLYGRAPEEFRKILDDCGLVALSSHVSVQEFEDPENGGVEAVAEKYAKIGVNAIGIPYLAGENRHPGGADFPESLASIKAIAKALAKYDITLTYHNHEFELETLPNGMRITDVFYGSLPADIIQAEFDLGWLTKAGADPIEYIRRYAGRIPQCHIKELAYTGKIPNAVAKACGYRTEGEDDPTSEFIFKPVGQGIMPFKAILPELEKAGCRQIIVEQDNATPGREIFDCVAESAQYLRSLMD